MKKLGITTFVLLALVAALTGTAGPAASLGLLAPKPAAPAPTTHVNPYLAGRLASVAPTASINVVINADTVEHAMSAARAAGVVPRVHMDRIGVIVGSGTAAAVKRLVGQPGVAWIGDADQPLQLQLDTSHRATRAEQARNEPSLATGSGSPYDGSGVGIMIIDGGIAGGHPMFNQNGVSKVRRNMEAIPLADTLTFNGEPGDSTGGWGLVVDAKTASTDDVAGHGTHVASTAAGYPVTTAHGHHLIGAAPGATLYGISVATAGSTYYGALAAQYWTLLHHAAPCGTPNPTCPPIRVVNNSYGPRGGGAYDPTDPTDEAMQLSIPEGVTWVWAAGNDGGDGSSDVTGPNAKDPTPGVLSVAAYDDGQAGLRDNQLASFSSRGLASNPSTWPDVSAPGVDIEAACLTTGSIDCAPDFLNDTEMAYGRLSGTSMASPHIAGYVAVLLQANPSLTPGQIEALLENTAHPFMFGAPYVNGSSFDKGHGLVDVTAALAQELGKPEPAVINYCVGTTRADDPAGDATDVGIAALTGSNPPGLSAVVMDMLWADARANAANTQFRIHLNDLKPSPNAASTGDYVRYDFLTGGRSFELIMTREVGASGPPTESFTLIEHVPNPSDPTGLPDDQTRAANLAGHFDDATNEAWVNVPAGTIPGIGSTDSISGVEILWQREVGVLTLTADTLRSLCPLPIGTLP